jgi:hypothetical protein
MFNRLYYRFNSWRYGAMYGCGRCHHGYVQHENADPSPCTVKGCPCRAYSIKRTTSDGDETEAKP